MRVFPRSVEEFIKMAEKGLLVPVYHELSASFETPLSVYLKVRQGSYSYLLESVERGVQVGRYSFIGPGCSTVLSAAGGEVTVSKEGKVQVYETADPLYVLNEMVSKQRVAKMPALPGFWGGAVGYMGYDMVRYFEKLPPAKENTEGIPDCVFMFSDVVLIYDHVRQVIQTVVNVEVGDEPIEDYHRAVKEIKRIERRLQEGLPELLGKEGETFSEDEEIFCSVNEKEYQSMVGRAKEYIRAGDIFQVVLSQQYHKRLKTSPLEVYRNLRSINPSPYMFYLEMDELKLVGSSPEILVRVEDGEVELRPIAGTRPRGKDAKEEEELGRDLSADEKERAEHLMLVDLGRNDLGRVCDYGSVEVTDFMEIEKYSHVIHLVSRIKGRLRAGVDNFDVMRACFPAGTVSGAPKIRAMEIIDELEPVYRGPYAGAVGYFGYNGNMDTCITIRTIVINNGKAYIQAGAGIVADSDPRKEYLECRNKAKALFQAIEAAEGREEG